MTFPSRRRVGTEPPIVNKFSHFRQQNIALISNMVPPAPRTKLLCYGVVAKGGLQLAALRGKRFVSAARRRVVRPPVALAPSKAAAPAVIGTRRGHGGGKDGHVDVR